MSESTVDWRAVGMAYSGEEALKLEAREIAAAGAFATAVLLFAVGQVPLAAGAAVVGVAAILVQGQRGGSERDVELDKSEEIDEALAPHYSG